MSVVPTDKWLTESWEEPYEIAEHLTDLYPEFTAAEIYQHLCMYGMYQLPLKNGENLVNALINNRSWDIVKKEEQRLRNLWEGPDVPIFIFPADTNNMELMEEFNGMSGLSNPDHLFLFLSGNHSEKEIRALFTHEYHHVCRLAKYEKAKEDYQLLDSIILEGLAEHAVSEQVGSGYNAKWTTYYSDRELERMWQRWISPALELPNDHPRYHDLLHGNKRCPKMAGYCVGYYLVRKYIDEHKLNSKELLNIPSEEIAKTEY